LRRVIIDSIIALLVATAAAWFTSEPLLEQLINHTMPEGVPVVFLGPAEGFTNRLKVALAVAVLVALPYLSWRMWQFIVPGLLERERRAMLPLSVASTVLFYSGFAFAYLGLVPVVIAILLSFGTGSLTPTIAIGPLLAFILRLCLACGLVFQMPLLAAVLTHLGVLKPAWLLSRWRYAVLFIFLASALLTPADAASQLILGLPVTALYFVSVGVSQVIYRRRRDDEADTMTAGEGEERGLSPEAAREEGVTTSPGTGGTPDGAEAPRRQPDADHEEGSDDE
jgi:sec-independent protein translocase protein TatC